MQSLSSGLTITQAEHDNIYSGWSMSHGFLQLWQCTKIISDASENIYGRNWVDMYNLVQSSHSIIVDGSLHDHVGYTITYVVAPNTERLMYNTIQIAHLSLHAIDWKNFHEDELVRLDELEESQ